MGFGFTAGAWMQRGFRRSSRRFPLKVDEAKRKRLARCPRHPSISGVESGTRSVLGLLIGLHPGFVEGGMFHRLAAYDEIAIDRMDRAVVALNDGRIVVRAGRLFFQMAFPLPRFAFVGRD